MGHFKDLEKILREVKLLARITNQHVVRYYSSWMEFMELSNDSHAFSECSDDISTLSKSSSTAECDNDSVDMLRVSSYDSCYESNAVVGSPICNKKTLVLFIQMEIGLSFMRR